MRIRTIKPEFWNSPDTAAASAVARLLYLAMWNWADDAGRGECDLKALEGFAFPNDDIEELSGGTSDNFRDVLAEVVDCYGVVVYMVDGRPYYEIPSWKNHQRNERVAKGRYPGSEEGVTCEVAELGGKRRKFRHTAAEAPQSSGPGTGEQGNRGTEEQRINTLAHREAASVSSSDFDAFWSAYPRKVGKDKARTKFAAAVKRAGAATVIAGAQRLAADPNLPEKRYIPHPTTWLERGGWDDEPLPARHAPATVAQFQPRRSASEKAQGWLNTIEEAKRIRGEA